MISGEGDQQLSVCSSVVEAFDVVGVGVVFHGVVIAPDGAVLDDELTTGAIRSYRAFRESQGSGTLDEFCQWYAAVCVDARGYPVGEALEFLHAPFFECPGVPADPHDPGVGGECVGHGADVSGAEGLEDGVGGEWFSCDGEECDGAVAVVAGAGTEFPADGYSDGQAGVCGECRECFLVDARLPADCGDGAHSVVVGGVDHRLPDRLRKASPHDPSRR